MLLSWPCMWFIEAFIKTFMILSSDHNFAKLIMLSMFHLNVGILMVYLTFKKLVLVLCLI